MGLIIGYPPWCCWLSGSGSALLALSGPRCPMPHAATQYSCSVNEPCHKLALPDSMLIAQSSAEVQHMAGLGLTELGSVLLFPPSLPSLLLCWSQPTPLFCMLSFAQCTRCCCYCCYNLATIWRTQERKSQEGLWQWHCVSNRMKHM